MAVKITKEIKENLILLGQHLEALRRKQKISKYRITKVTGLKDGQIDSIEKPFRKGKIINYTTVSLLAYCKVINVDLVELILAK